ncbi:AraC family transcriptional regulator [Flavobacterium noncentrifugens]|uniref:AraC-type DNA-binding protein n=1 Tax=Flavobacterium noncentrifugens TaxID=1128970 RepID=A0A1G8RQU5_9FLAO|nr:helix-turn-helix transcriptional regulator [Flavobacterium noncentrifugens]GEP49539.1 AraC family transcriptional regulator [Flavobacterium noncentrifugens]SDJ19283.1 AraC-type DNA-binding protein [Flavobacterium noncentrifugens]
MMKKYPIYEVGSFKCNAESGEFYVNTFQSHLQTHSFVEEPHRHSSYLLVFFTKGSGTHEIDFDMYEIQPGSLFVLQPGQIHNWNLSDDIDGFVVIYAQEVYDLYFGQKNVKDYPFYMSNSSKPEWQLNTDEQRQILPYFEAMIIENSIKNKFSIDKMLNLLDCIHIEMARKYAVSEMHAAHSYNTKIKQFETEIERYFKHEKLPSFYASKLSITLKHLNRISNEILGKTATKVVINRVILEAKRMLTDKNLSVNEVADALGYDDYSYFARVFKKQTGLSPTAFRMSKK